ncbi:acyl-CoA dehydrogenase family protein [Nocardia sp. CC227C]|uniref:acyl-CoA dehydrogenase family protein n=1 Tax=Nocardia sp. CC227C TaxID=3044562 RepID=UPI00278C6755|nr:acyl-CoA dehydrogenase family protein [Nocardia sp. CC227C]
MFAGRLPKAAVEVAALVGPYAAEAEQTRRLHPDAFKALVEAGFMRHFAPTDCGGAAGTFGELTAAVTTVGEVCTSTAWCASLSASMSRMAAAFLPPDGYREIWAAGPDTVIVGSVTPLGRAAAEGDGWRLSGRWPYISAVDFSDWALLCAQTDDGDSKLFAIPRADFRYEDTWHSVGMQGTGSNTVIAKDVFVPALRTFDRADLFAGRSHDGEAPCHAVPLEAVNGLSFVVPALGAAQGAVKAFETYIGRKISSTPSLPGVPGVQGNQASYEMALARSASELDAAKLLLHRATATADRGADISPLEAARNLRDCSFAADLLVSTVNRVVRAAGTTGQTTDGVIQRFWRDVTSISTHMAVQFEPAARTYTRVTLGL